jgi:ADP-ribosylglycohydrolase
MIMEHSVRAPSHAPLERALCSLEGLVVGDAFGERFFVHPKTVEHLSAARALPAPPWWFTDDTQLALSIVAVLRRHGRIDQEHLAQHFAAHYDPSRGYGPAMHGVLARIHFGEPWQAVAPGLLAGQGSFGNGAAMRVAPVGAYYADDRGVADRGLGREGYIRRRAMQDACEVR